MKDKHPDSPEKDMLENNSDQPENNQNGQESEETAQDNAPEKDELQQQLEEARSKYLYLLSDFETYKRNSAKERVELQQTAGRDIVTELLSVLDDFDRASKNDSLNPGTTLIHQKLQQILLTKGLTELECKPGDAFNPDTHDAIAEIPAPSEDKKGKIIEVIEKGYLLGGRNIRFAKVVVGC